MLVSTTNQQEALLRRWSIKLAALTDRLEKLFTGLTRRIEVAFQRAEVANRLHALLPNYLGNVEAVGQLR